MVLVGRSGSVVLCTAGLEDKAAALSPGKCGSYRHILTFKQQCFPLASMPSQSNTRDIVQALYDMTSHKLQQKLFYLFCTPEGTLFDM